MSKECNIYTDWGSFNAVLKGKVTYDPKSTYLLCRHSSIKHINDMIIDLYIDNVSPKNLLSMDTLEMIPEYVYCKKGLFYLLNVRKLKITSNMCFKFNDKATSYNWFVSPGNKTYQTSGISINNIKKLLKRYTISELKLLLTLHTVI